jgi:hypothetical protein
VKQCESLGFGLNRERKAVRVSYIDRNAELGSLWASLIEALHKFDSNRPMRRTTIRLTGGVCRTNEPLLSDDWPLFVTSQKPIGDVGRLLPIAA